MKALDDHIPKKGEIRTRVWNEIWVAEQWNGLYWTHMHHEETQEEIEHWVNYMWSHPNVDTRASD